MIKKAVCLLLSIAVSFSLSGCWSYRGLNEITIVAGVGIDKDPISGSFHLACELIDLATSGKEGGVKAKIVESDGKTIFDAVRNAKKRLLNKLYWGNTQIVVIGNELAKQGDVGTVVNWFLNDAECRETIDILVSQEKTAKQILTIDGLDNSVVSYEIKKIIDSDSITTASIRGVQLFKAFNTLREPGISLALPMFHCTVNDEASVVEANGEAVFKGEKMVGGLSADETKDYLFVVDDINGGVLTLSSAPEILPDISLEIATNKTKRSYSYSQGKVKFMIQTNTDVYLDEVAENMDLLDEQKISKIEAAAASMLENSISAVIKKMQTQYNSDIFGFGHMIYQKDPKLWEQIESKWDNLFPTAQVQVQCKVNIVNTAALIKS